MTKCYTVRLDDDYEACMDYIIAQDHAAGRETTHADILRDSLAVLVDRRAVEDAEFAIAVQALAQISLERHISGLSSKLGVSAVANLTLPT